LNLNNLKKGNNLLFKSKLIKVITKKTELQIVNEMDFGWTMANAFECYNSNIKIDNPDDQITLWGNEIPTKVIFVKLKKMDLKQFFFL